MVFNLVVGFITNHFHYYWSIFECRRQTTKVERKRSKRRWSNQLKVCRWSANPLGGPKVKFLYLSLAQDGCQRHKGPHINLQQKNGGQKSQQGVGRPTTKPKRPEISPGGCYLLSKVVMTSSDAITNFRRTYGKRRRVMPFGFHGESPHSQAKSPYKYPSHPSLPTHNFDLNYRRLYCIFCTLE